MFDILLYLKAAGDAAGAVKSLADIHKLLTSSAPRSAMALRGQQLIESRVIDQDLWDRFISIDTALKQREGSVSHHGFIQSLETIYEIECRINASRFRTSNSQGIATRVSWILNDPIIPKGQELLENLATLSADASDWQHLTPTRSDVDSIRQLGGIDVHTTPSYIAEIVCMLSAMERYSLKINVNITHSSFLETAKVVADQAVGKSSYIFGVDVSCIRLFPELKECMALVDVLGALRNRMLIPSATALLENSGKIYLPFGENSSTFHYAMNKFKALPTGRIEEIKRFSSLLNIFDGSAGSINLAVAWSPYWQLVWAMGRAEMAGGHKFDDQPYGNWLLKLTNSGAPVTNTDRMFGAVLRAEMRHLASDDARVRRLTKRAVREFRLDEAVAKFLGLQVRNPIIKAAR